MRDSLDDALAEAGEFLLSDADLDRALRALVEARAPDAADAAKSRHTSKAAPVVAIGLALAVASGGAVAASQWGPWAHLFELDIVVARDWKDDSGAYLGSCETSFVIGSLPADTRADLRDYLAALDVDSIEPDADVVTAELEMHSVLNELRSRLAEKAAPDFIARHDESTAGREQDIDVRVLQAGLVHAVALRITDELRVQHPHLNMERIATLTRTHCTTEPGRAGDQ